MSREYRTIEEPAFFEQEIKKSRFIGQLYPISSLEEAQEVLGSVKKRYWDATHNCSAAITGLLGEYMRCSDDSEPQGTAGVPMLEALKGSGLTNVLAVVTRYFGGTLLGTGGLARAYAGTVNGAVAAAKKLLFRESLAFRLTLPFKLWGKAQSAFLAAGFGVEEVQYAEAVSCIVTLPPEQKESFQALTAELSAGNAVPKEIGIRFLRIPC